MEIRFYKYHGAGNDFIIIDNRKFGFFAATIEQIAYMCNRRFGIGADGLMLLQENPDLDFEMRYFNSDGREASMCGNGGRCIVALASRLGIIGKYAKFLAVDGIHEAEVLDSDQVNLKMSDVGRISELEGGFFLDTGSPHFVKFVDDIGKVDVYNEGKTIRYSETFRKEGTNVNFVEEGDNWLTVYTYERGVEDETLACGTGITASALCAALRTGAINGNFNVKAKGGDLSVSFEKSGYGFRNIWLKGPAAYVFEGNITL